MLSLHSVIKAAFAASLVWGGSSTPASASLLTTRDRKVASVSGYCSAIFTRVSDAKIPVNKKLSRNIPKESYRIEKSYPNYVIHDNRLPVGSKSFILWRQNTPTHIPDVVFLQHYLDDDTLIDVMRDAAGFGEILAPQSVELARPDTSLLDWNASYMENFFVSGYEPFGFSFSKRNKHFGRVWPSELLKQNFGSLENLEKLLGISLVLTKAKKESLKTVMLKTPWREVRYFIESSGKFWLIRNEECSRLAEAIGFEGATSHLFLADLIWGGRQDSVDLVATGWINFTKDGRVKTIIDTAKYDAFDVKKYFNNY